MTPSAGQLRAPRKFSAHIGCLFTELPLIERIAAARAAGFEAVEHPQPFAIDAPRMRQELQGSGLSFVQLAAGVGDPEKGEKGLAALPGREADFREGLLRSIDYATAIGCRLVHPMAGVPAREVDRDEVRATYIENLQFAVQEAEAAGLAVLVEPISEVAVPGYFASTMEVVMDVADEVAPHKIGILLDTFHARASGLDTADFIRRNPNRISHVHISDYPGRHEPGTGSFDFPSFLEGLNEVGYSGAIGFEYVPSVATNIGLRWLSDPLWRKSPSAVPSTVELKLNFGIQT
jgi:hydroxypyruvate isomerase